MAVKIVKQSKDRSFRGMKIEELKTMDTREFAKHVKSRERRSILRNYDVLEKFVKKCDVCSLKNKPIRTHSRELVIIPKMVGKTIFVYNGQEFLKVEINEQMLGHRLGEFSLTRKIARHTKAGVGSTKSNKK